MNIKAKNIGDFLTPVFASIGYGVSTTEHLQNIFLVLTIVSLSFSILSRFIIAIKGVLDKTKKALDDGKLTKDELDDIAFTVISEYEAIKNSDDVKELQDVMKNKGE